VSENLDLVRSIVGPWERGDYGATDWAAAEVEYVHVEGPAPGTWIGIPGMAEGWREMLSVTAGHRVEAYEYRELEGDRVLVLFHLRGTGKTSGVDLGRMQANVASLFHINHGMVVRLVNYLDHDRALADLGLDEQALSDESAASDLGERVRIMLDSPDPSDFDAILASYAADAVWAMPTEEFTGVDAIRRHWEEWFDSYEDFWFESAEIVDFGNGVVLAVVRQGGRLGGGAPELRQELALIYEWSKGVIVRVTASAAHADIDEARGTAERLAQERR
jgi:ketosteroid isomerase-like protein